MSSLGWPGFRMAWWASVLLCLTVVGMPASATFQEERAPLVVGAERDSLYLPLLRGKRVGLVVNQTSRHGSVHLVDFLLERGIRVTRIFAPEHGFRGNRDAGAVIEDGRDPATRLPVTSLYGQHKGPTAAHLADVDVLIFDIQDVGVRFYTYISTLHHVMESCADHRTPLLIFDRPNPNGDYVDGPVLDPQFRSFVGMHPIPLVHGLTVGELAGMIQGEAWLASEQSCQLQVIPVRHYDHQRRYSLPVPPSPNLPNDQAIRLYPALGLFEATPISIGRGTEAPFQRVGYADSTLGHFRFQPRSTPGAALHPKLENQWAYGEDLATALSPRFTLAYLLDWQAKFRRRGLSFIKYPAFMDKLAGSDTLRRQLAAGLSAEAIRASWQPALDKYRLLRRGYLLYPEQQRLSAVTKDRK